MNINGLELPATLESNLSGQPTLLTVAQKKQLAKFLTATETAFPELFDRERVNEANLFWNSAHVEQYLGSESQSSKPGDIDKNKTVIIGQAEPDSPLVLDYRTCPPRILYFADSGYWVELCQSYDALMSLIGKEPTD